jgi:Flp pilus assembly pilin Flp
MKEKLKKINEFHNNESGATTAEYAIVILAATGFAGLLVAILSSGTVKSWLENLIQKALNQ